MAFKPRLTARQLEVLTLVAEGLSNATIAERLGVSVATVKDHLSAVYRELGVENRTQAALVALGMGLTARRRGHGDERLRA